MINSSPWRRNFRNSISVVAKTWFNLAGVVQPDVAVNLLNDAIVCPPEVDFDEMTVKSNEVSDLMTIFENIDISHPKPEGYRDLYTLDKDALL